MEDGIERTTSILLYKIKDLNQSNMTVITDEPKK